MNAPLRLRDPDLLGSIVEGLPLPAYACDAEGRLLWWNRGAVELWGREPSGQGERWTGAARTYRGDGSVLPPDEAPLATLVRDHVEFTSEIVIERPDGTKRHVVVRSRPVEDDDGVSVGGLAVILDVTERRDAEEALEASESRFRAMADSTPVMVWTTDREGRGAWFNRRWLEFTGQPMDDAVGDGWIGAVHPDDRDDVLGQSRAALGRGSPFQIELRLRRADGQFRWVLVHGIPQRVKNGARGGYVASGVDITHRKTSEESVRESEARYRQLAEGTLGSAVYATDPSGRITFFNDAAVRLWTTLAAIVDSTSDAIVSKNLDGIVTSWNHSAERLFGYRASEAVGRHISFLIPRDRLNEEDEIVEAVAAGERYELETVRLTRDGRRIDVAITVSPVTDAQGNVIGASKIVRDITERKRVERSLRESEGRFRYLADHAPVLIWVNDAEGCQFVNREYLRFLGVDVEDVLGMVWLRYVHPEDADHVLAAYRLAVEARGPFDAEFRFRRHDGEYRWMRSNGVPRIAEDGEFLGYVGCSVDITDVKQSESALKEADQRKDEFLGMLGHELRNPLAAMETGAELLRQRPTDQDRSWIEQMMARQIDQLHRLVDDLVDVTRITRGKIQLRIQDVDVRAQIACAVEAVSGEVREHGHRLDVRLPDDAVTVMADPARLEQMLVNLLTNAIKYTPDGGRIELEAEIVRSRSRMDELVIRCRDSGVGIAPDSLGRIFEPFVQIDAAPDRTESGLGMGLFLVKRLSELHGGSIDVTSEGAGLGSEFTLRLPVDGPDGARDGVDGRRGEGRPAMGPLRVLVIEDNRDYADGLARLLRGAGHQVSLAHDGQSGLLAALRERPEVVLLDIGLPGIDGYVVARSLRSTPQMSDAKIIAVSGFSRDTRRWRDRPDLFDAQLLKPVERSDLFSLLEHPGSGVGSDANGETESNGIG